MHSDDLAPATSATPFSLERLVERLPPGLVVERLGGALRIRNRRRHRGMLAFLILWCAIWDTIFVAIASSGQLPLLFWFTHGLSGLAMTYFTLNLALNHTSIDVAGGELRVSRRPIPWPFSKRLTVAGLKRLWVAEGNTRLNGVPLLALWMEQQPQGKSVLIDALPDREVGETLERLIEDHLRIDESAPGGSRKR